MSALLGRWPRLLSIAGIVLLIAAVQAWGFHRQAKPLLAVAHEELTALQHEVPDNRLLNLSLQQLQEYWRASGDELTRRQILELRDSLYDRFAAEPVTAIGEFARVVGGFDARSAAEQETLATLEQRVARLERMYADHFGAARRAVTHPAWYLQPTASFLNNDAARNRALAFNHALYLLHVRETGAAVELLDELRRDDLSPALYSKALLALARLQYDAFRVEKDDAYFREALQYAQHSVQRDAGNALAKVFLDYLLSVDREATEVDVSPLEGEGTGEGEGERGAINVEPGEF